MSARPAPKAAHAKPAVFDRSKQAQRAAIAKVQIAKKQLGMADDDYRQLLLRVTGKMSSTELTMPEFDRLLAELGRMGFTAKAKVGGAAKGRPADHPAAMKARALWISLGHMGVVANPSEPALEAFAARQLKVARLQWADQARVYKLIEALKAMAERAGWSQSTEGLKDGVVPRVLRQRLCDAILARLVEAGLADAGWDLRTAAHRLAGIELPKFAAFVSDVELDRVAGALGDRLRGVRERAS